MIMFIIHFPYLLYADCLFLLGLPVLLNPLYLLTHTLTTPILILYGVSSVC